MIKLLSPFNWGGKVYPPGTERTFPSDTEDALIAAGNAEPFKNLEPLKTESSQGKDPEKESEKEPEKEKKPPKKRGHS